MGMMQPDAESIDQRFDRLLQEHGQALARLAAAYERDFNDREDLLQEIAFAIWRSLPSFRGECSERTFVFRIGHNRAITHSTQGARRRSRTVDGAEALSVPDPRPDATTRLVAAEQRERLMDAVRRLTPVLREAIVLKLEGLSNDDIAAVVGTSAANVAVRLTRGRDALSRLLGASEDS
jgi:RNA polymerase sigma-70 factor (ECF subfamily)